MAPVLGRVTDPVPSPVPLSCRDVEILGMELLVLDWLLCPLPLYPHFSRILLLSTCASVTTSLLILGIVPTKRLFGLDVAHGGLVGLAVLCLLGPATGAGYDGPAWPCEELLLELVALVGVLPMASLAISARLAWPSSHLWRSNNCTTAAAPSSTEPSYMST